MKKYVFKKEIGYIRNSEYRENAERLIELLPDYFFTVAASSTGKYHPKFAALEGGLVRHTKVAVRIGYELLYSMIGDVFSPREKDLIILGLMLHDGLKHGKTLEKYTRFDHPILASEFVLENQGKTTFNDEDIKFLADIIASHMGPYNTNQYSDVVLPKPKNKYQKFVHMCDLLASRKFLNVEFNGNEIID
ncbi:MAG: HD domain-containing protein [Bacilli bacterium]|nr:HD domain-containing protein [Bacilli bacterium]